MYFCELSRDDIIEKMKRNNEYDIFDYSFWKEEEEVYFMPTNIRRLGCNNAGEVKYKMMIQICEHGCFIQMDVISRSSRCAEEGYEWEMNYFMRKKLGAKRIA